MNGAGVVESAALEALVQRMCQEFDVVSADEIRDHVRAFYADFADAPVQTFVPVLVEKRLRHLLRRSTEALRTAPALTG